MNLESNTSNLDPESQKLPESGIPQPFEQISHPELPESMISQPKPESMISQSLEQNIPQQLSESTISKLFEQNMPQQLPESVISKPLEQNILPESVISQPLKKKMPQQMPESGISKPLEQNQPQQMPETVISQPLEQNMQQTPESVFSKLLEQNLLQQMPKSGISQPLEQSLPPVDEIVVSFYGNPLPYDIRTNDKDNTNSVSLSSFIKNSDCLESSAGTAFKVPLPEEIKEQQSKENTIKKPSIFAKVIRTSSIECIEKDKIIMEEVTKKDINPIIKKNINELISHLEEKLPQQKPETVISEPMEKEMAQQMQESMISKPLEQNLTDQAPETIISEPLKQNMPQQIPESVISKPLEKNMSQQMPESIFSKPLEQSKPKLEESFVSYSECLESSAGTVFKVTLPEEIKEQKSKENIIKKPSINAKVRTSSIECNKEKEKIINEESKKVNDPIAKKNINELIPHLMEAFKKEENKFFMKNLEKIHMSLINEKEKTKLLFVGPCSSGKTTLVNLILSYSDEGQSFSDEFRDLLPTSERAGSYLNWIIENHPDENSMVLNYNNEEIIFSREKIDDFKMKLKQISLEKNKYDEIVLKLPLKILDNFSIIDCATLRQENLKFLQENFFTELCYLIYVKNMGDAEKIEENIIKMINDKSRYEKEACLRSVLWVYSKKDRFFQINPEDFDEIKEQNLSKEAATELILHRKNEEIKTMGISIREIVKEYANIENIRFLNLLKPEKSNEDLKEFQEFLREINSALRKYRSQKIFHIFDNLSKLWTDYLENLNQKKEKINSFVNQLYIKNRLDEAVDLIQKDLNFNEFFIKLSEKKTFQTNFPDVYAKLKKTLEDLSDLKNCSKYVEAQEVINKEIHLKIKSRIQFFFNHFYKLLLAKYGFEIQENNFPEVDLETPFKFQGKNLKSSQLKIQISNEIFQDFSILFGFLNSIMVIRSIRNSMKPRTIFGIVSACIYTGFFFQIRSYQRKRLLNVHLESFLSEICERTFEIKNEILKNQKQFMEKNSDLLKIRFFEEEKEIVEIKEKLNELKKILNRKQFNEI